MDVESFRQRIPVCQRMAYLNTGMSGPSPVPVVDAIKKRLDYEMEEGLGNPDVVEGTRALRDAARRCVASFLNASPEEICITKNTTDGLNMVLNGLPWQPGDEIVTCDLEHSSVIVPSYFKQRQSGVVMNMVSMAPDEPMESILSKIEAAITPRTRLVFLSHIEWSSGLRMPVEGIRRLTRDMGVKLLLDGAQTAGHIRLNMKELDCDFYSIPGQKWLLGSEGVGALYIRQDRIEEVAPVHLGGRAVLPHSGPRELEPNTASMDKFLMSSSSTALQAGLMAAIDFIQEAGISDIEQRNLDLAGALKDSLRETPGVTVLSPFDRQISSGLVTFAIDGVDPEQAVAELWKRNKIAVRRISYPACIRASLHFFNTENEVANLAEAVRGLAETGVAG